MHRADSTAQVKGKQVKGKKAKGTMADDKAEPLRSDSPVHVVIANVTAPATLPAGYEFEAQIEGGDPERTVHAVVVSFCSLATLPLNPRYN